jgi:hypothetical protein
MHTLPPLAAGLLILPLAHAKTVGSLLARREHRTGETYVPTFSEFCELIPAFALGRLRWRGPSPSLSFTKHFSALLLFANNRNDRIKATFLSFHSKPI